MPPARRNGRYLGRKLALTTVVAAVIWLGIYIVVQRALVQLPSILI